MGFDARDMVESWRLAMVAARRSPRTIESYLRGVTQLLDWLDANGRPADLSDPEHVRAWLAAHRDDWEGTTMQVRLAAVRAFAKFMMQEGELDSSGAARVEWPKLDEKIPPAFTPEQVREMIGTCSAKTFTGTRDAALISLSFSSLLRRNELLSMRMKTDDHPGDIDLKNGLVRVRRGKGGKERISVFDADTATRLDRYLRYRARHKNAHLEAVWLAEGRGELSDEGLYWAIRRHGEAIGIKAYPHMSRAGGAIQWRSKNGSTEGLMAIAGWTNVQMVMRYTRAAQMELAIAEAKRLHEK